MYVLAELSQVAIIQIQYYNIYFYTLFETLVMLNNASTLYCLESNSLTCQFEVILL